MAGGQNFNSSRNHLLTEEDILSSELCLSIQTYLIDADSCEQE